MERSEIDVYLTDQFWDSSDLVMFTTPGLTIERRVLPAGSILFQTSGSSGSRKWVVHTRESILESAKLVTKHLKLTPKDNWFLAIPINHVGGFGILARSHYSGCSITHYNEKWNAQKAISIMHREQVTLSSFVPAQVVDIVNDRLECPSSVRAVIVGGGRLDHVLKLKAVSLGWPILESYGMTETGSQIATQRSSSDDSLALINGWEVKVNPQGILEIKGKGLMKGYIVSRGDQFELSTPFDENGWFETTDQVELLGDSKYIKFISRNDRAVKILGELVNLDELESNLKKTSNTDILIVEIPNERRGYSLYPIIERCSHDKLDIEQLNLSGLHRLEPLIVCDSFPRNTMGKLDRSRLRELVVLSE